MTGHLHEVPEGILLAVMHALRMGKLKPPFTRASVEHIVGGPPWLADELSSLVAQGLSPAAMAWGISLLAEAKAEARFHRAGVELTWTGPPDVITETRDTGAVARQLFAAARTDLLVSTFVVDGGDKAAALLGVLRDRLVQLPDLRVRFFLNFARAHGDTRPSADLLAGHARRFLEDVWPWTPRPEVFYDRRALDPTPGPRSCLHAKCIVQDEVKTLITSANLTEAAQERNIEAGVLVTDGGFAREVVLQFERLVAAGVLVRMGEGR
ncbi:DISARM system phospholipase D-like protein DrmC [Myxococcota bacterium]|nr:DISARM system phospholipase D-like protein DrmC [Myxococcota bacterium]